MLFGKGKTPSLNPAVFDEESEKGCKLQPIEKSIFPPFSAYSSSIGNEDVDTFERSHCSVAPALFITSMADLKEKRNLLQSFDPPAVTHDDNYECEVDGCVLDFPDEP